MVGVADGDDDGRLGQVQSLVRAFGLLEAIGAHEEGLTLTSVARLVKLPPSTAHRLLTTLGALRYVEFDQTTSHWVIGRKAFSLVMDKGRNCDLGRLGKQIMRSLMLESNQTVNIAVSEADCVRYVGQVRPPVAPPEATQPGWRWPIHTTALGKVILAYSTPDEIDAFLLGASLRRRTPSSIIERQGLFSQLSIIRTRGYAIDDEENEKGIRCVAAPVFDCHRRVRASLSITGNVARLPNDRLKRLGQTLAAAAQRFSDDVGAFLAA